MSTFDVRTDTRQALADRVTELEGQLDRLARVADVHSLRLEQVEATLTRWRREPAADGS